ncbi:hypothetical protein CDD83_4435 [Cordyceps sp. RAO-2017]|nr:hypothetical protein CDD83_4435 [Cordyceps sp. RAO-2017]
MRAARRELKQSSISDPPQSAQDTFRESVAKDPIDACGAAHFGGVSVAAIQGLKATTSTPKKKRAHDQLNDNKQAPDHDDTSVVSADSAIDRASRLEPEKKRHREDGPTDAVLKPLQSDALSAANEDHNERTFGDEPIPNYSPDAFTTSGFGNSSEV